MSRPPKTPPLKCQGIKTKLVDRLRSISQLCSFDRWVEPFCGSCVVPLNIQPKKAVLRDSNVHIIRLYSDIKSGLLTPGQVREFLNEQGSILSAKGEPYYYEVRERFNDAPNSLDFLFLNRACFNGVMRFNGKGRFNVPYCHKPNRFAQAYVTKIVNQVACAAEVIRAGNWDFQASDFRETLSTTKPTDLVYLDPPYAGRHTDYFNRWSEDDEQELIRLVRNLPSKFMFSTWHSNEFRRNASIDQWKSAGYTILTKEHFYHVGSSEDLRHPMIEAIITNFQVNEVVPAKVESKQAVLF